MKKTSDMRRDLYKRESSYKNWIVKVEANNGEIEGLTPQNAFRLIDYLKDMERGRNIAKGTAKGSRSWSRLVALKNRMIWIMKHLQERGALDVIDTTEDIIDGLFSDITEERIVRLDGKPYKSTSDFVKTFKAFWGWMMKVEKKKLRKNEEGRELDNIAEDLDASGKKAPWVSMTPTEFKELVDGMRVKEYRMYSFFLFDTSLRPPTEALNCKRSDILGDFDFVKLRDECAKTFGRTIELRISKDNLREHGEENNIKGDDYLFNISVKQYNRYLQRHAFKKFGNRISPGGKAYKDITQYDIRHISICYWSPKYDNRKVFHTRSGVTNEGRITYYTEDIGLTDSLDGKHTKDPWKDIVKSKKDIELGRLAKENEELRAQIKGITNSGIIHPRQPIFSFQSAYQFPQNCSASILNSIT